MYIRSCCLWLGLVVVNGIILFTLTTGCVVYCIVDESSEHVHLLCTNVVCCDILTVHKDV